jgi:arylsulfatase A-like enzyme
MLFRWRLSIFCLFLLILCTCRNDNQKSLKPNIILIIADDMGYSDAGCYGQTRILTPNIDRLALDGIRFTDHYAGTSVCAPSRCVLMTGLHTGHSAVRGNMEANPYGQFQLPDETITVAELLKQAGYTTGQFGKWGLGVENTTGDPQNQGFDEFFGYYCQVHAHNSFPEYLYENRNKVYLDNEVIYMPKDSWSRGLGSYATKKIDYSNDLIVDKALDFITENKKRPFFVYLPVTIPHENGEAPENEKLEVPGLSFYSDSNWTSEDQAYAAMISRLDGYVGKIRDLLEKLSIEKNTAVFFTSDNGGFRYSQLNHNGSFRGIKRDLYEGGIRVPLIVWWPEIIQSGRVSNHISGFIDFLPTVCEMANIEIPDFVDGKSYLPTLEDKNQAGHEYLYWEFHEMDKKQAVRMGKWKGVRLNVFQDPEAPVELYDLNNDPSETHDISAANPEIANLIKEIMQKEHRADTNWRLFNSEF